jgi:cellulose synthase/poly-beta-1,6-N-acetylglucosamine synthase-like glycosyltransferase
MWSASLFASAAGSESASAAMAASALLALLLLGLYLLLVMASAHLLRLGLWALRRPLRDEDGGISAGDRSSDPDDRELPVVTVQLPMRNERFVARRAIEAACALDWPLARLQIQVLDDSDDETVAEVDAAIAEMRARGVDISAVRRESRASFKAGHLDFALPSARGELVAVFDADFVPPKDFLRRASAVLRSDEKLAFVQGRWGFLNERASLLTRCQALILHGLMLVEQAYLSAHGRPVQFNGSGGLWRKAALLAAGGWVGTAAAASVTEDLDLSYRVHLLGYRARHLPALAVPTELPETMAAFRAQQQRWVRGGAQVLRELLQKLAAPSLGWKERISMLLHLVRHARQPYLALSLLWLPVVGLGLLPLPFSPPGGLLAAVLLLFLALAVYYGAALRRLGRPPLVAALEAVALVPLLCALSMGLSLALTSALARGVLGGRAAAEFVRTPKTGQGTAAAPTATMTTAATAPTTAARVRLYRPVRDRLARLEVVLGALYLALAALAVWRGQYIAALGLGVLVAGGLLWVGGGSLRVPRS